MSDLGKRLRNEAVRINSYQSDPSAKPQDLIEWEAADRIEELHIECNGWMQQAIDKSALIEELEARPRIIDLSSCESRVRELEAEVKMLIEASGR